MRASLAGFILFSSLALFAVSFGVASWQTRSSLSQFEADERVRRTADGLESLGQSADRWRERQVARAKDVAALPVLIQGVLQPEASLREMRRYLDHLKWEGESVQIDILDFEGTTMYRRLATPILSHDKESVQSLLQNARASFTQVQVSDGLAWVSVGVAVGREGYPEGLFVATLSLDSLSSELTRNSSDGVELRLGDRLLDHFGETRVSESIAFRDSGLSIHFGPDLTVLEESIAGLEYSVAIKEVAIGIFSVILLTLLIRTFLSRPLAGFLRMLEGIKPDGIPHTQVARQRFSELDRLSVAFNGLIDRLAESQLRLVRMNASLEDRVSRRTTELQARNADLERFAYVASHDLQEPLRKIGSFSEILCAEHSQQLDEDGLRFLAVISNAALRMRGLIQDLLDFSRIGRDGADLSSVDLNAILASVVDDVRPALEEADGDLRVDDLPIVRGHRGYLSQLFTNLLTNAIKFGGEEAPDIHVGVELNEDECIVFVRDRGIGIAQKNFEKVFGMFERLHSRAEYAGSGIGLAICKRIVEELGGRMWLDSTVGKGTTFFVALRLETENQEEKRA